MVVRKCMDWFSLCTLLFCSTGLSKCCKCLIITLRSNGSNDDDANDEGGGNMSVGCDDLGVDEAGCNADDTNLC